MVEILSYAGITEGPIFGGHRFDIVELGNNEDESDLDDWILEQQKKGRNVMRRPIQIGISRKYRVLREN